MPTNDNHVKLQYDDRDYTDLKLASTIAGYPNLKAWATQVLTVAARQIVTQYRTAQSGYPAAITALYTRAITCPDCGEVAVTGDVYEQGTPISGMCPTCGDRLFFAPTPTPSPPGEDKA